MALHSPQEERTKNVLNFFVYRHKGPFVGPLQEIGEARA